MAPLHCTWRDEPGKSQFWRRPLVARCWSGHWSNLHRHVCEETWVTGASMFTAYSPSWVNDGFQLRFLGGNFQKLIIWWPTQTSYDFSISGRVFSRKTRGTISLYLSTAARYAPTHRWRLSWEAGITNYGDGESVPVPHFLKIENVWDTIWHHNLIPFTF